MTAETLSADALKMQKLEELKKLRRESERLQQLEARLKFSSDPTTWVTQTLNEHLWSKQVEILESIRDNRRTAVQACHGPGKSFTLARAVCWWLATHPIGDAFVVTTAPTFPQVRAILWREIAQAFGHGDLRGSLNQTEWIMDGQLVAFGRKPSDYEPGAFQGIHATYVLVVIDEACYVPKTLWDATETLITNDSSRIVAIGNPDDPVSEFAANCRPGSGWHTIKISAFDTPAFTGEPCPDDVLARLTGRLWVDERRKKWGTDHPFWQSKVLGEFPKQATDALLSWDDIHRAHERFRTGDFTTDGPHTLGCDVARYGDDMTVIAERKGMLRTIYRSYAKQSTTDTADRCHDALDLTGAEFIAIDADGVGGGVFDQLDKEGVPVVELHSAMRSRDPEKFGNKRAEFYWSLHDEFEKDEVALDPGDEDTTAQLLGIKWKRDPKRRILMVGKEEMKRLGLKSPDRADALVYASAAQFIDWGSVYGVSKCLCGESFMSDPSGAARACPKCGRIVRSSEQDKIDA